MFLSILILLSFLLIGCDTREAPTQKGTQTVTETAIEEEIPKEETQAEPGAVAEEDISQEEIKAEITEAEEPEQEAKQDAAEVLKDFGPVWNKRIDNALAASDCPPISKIQYPSSYYQGPLIDTHLHIPAIPDWSPEDEEEANEETPEGRFGGPQALLGWNVKMSEIACTLKNEGTTKNFAFFPVYEHIPEELLEIVHQTTEQYPELFTSFIMSSGSMNVASSLY